MSFFYICSDCCRGYTSEDLTKIGVANKTFKSPWQPNVPLAGMYSANPTYRCPYCLSKNRTAGSEHQRMIYLREKHTYPPADPRWLAVQTAQKYEDCEWNVDMNEQKIQGLSGDAMQRLQKFMETCSWNVSHEQLKKMTAVFPRGVICFFPSEKTWYVYQKKEIFCAVRRGETCDEYLFSADGIHYDRAAEADCKLLRKLNEAISDYSMLLRMPT